MFSQFAFRSVLTLVCVSSAFLPLLPVRAQNAPAPPSPTVAVGDDFTARLAKTQQDLDAKREEFHVPGAALVIVKDDKIVAIQGMGLRDRERKLPVTPQTLFAIGSSTKAFTAMTALMSVDDGKLSLSDPPRKYLPYFKLKDPDADAKITVSDLLCHRSGLERTDLAWYTGKLRSPEVIQVAGEAKPTAKLGEKFQYQNVMFLAAGEVVAGAQGRPWGDVLKTRIFKPLGMKDSTLSIRDMQRRSDFSRGYSYNSNTKETHLLPTRDLSVIAPAGAINSNAQDMAQWLRLMLGGGKFEGKTLLSEASFTQLLTKHMDVGGPIGYSYGWFLRSWNGHKVVEHGGNIDGFSAAVALMPDQHLGFVLLTNLNDTPLQALALDIVWNDLLGTPSASAPTDGDTAAAPTAPAGDPAREVGLYSLLPKLNLDIKLQDGKLMAQPTGQINLPLKNVGGRRYVVDMPGVTGIFLTFRPAKDDANATELLFEQNGAKMVAKKKAVVPFASPLSPDALMAKVIEAAGGEANLRKHKTMRVRTTLEMPGQGITGEVIAYNRAPSASAEITTLWAAGKKIATQHKYFDGAQGGDENSFTTPTTKSGSQINDALIASDFYRELNWKTAFKTTVIKAIEKVGGEDAYVVEKTPEKGSSIVERYSTKTFLLLQRDTQATDPESGITINSVATYSDYRPVDGVMIPFKVVETALGGNETITLVKDVKFDAPLPVGVFRSSGKKQR